MSDERRIDLDTGKRHNLLWKVRRGWRLWRSGEVSLRRVVNAGLCHLSLRWRSSRVLGKPYYLTVEPTNACNLRCPLCPTGRRTLGRKTTRLPLDLYKRCVDELGPYLMKVGLANYGEPLLHRHIVEMIAYAKARGSRVVMASNGILLEKAGARALVQAGLDHIWISFDGTDQETYAKYRVGGELNGVIRAVRALLEARKSLGRTNPFIELQFLVMRHNQHQIEDFRRVADELGVDGRIIKPVSFNVADWDDPDVRKTFFGEFFPENEQYRIYRRRSDGWWWKKDKLDFCTAPWRSMTVLADGSIVPCCRDPRGRYTMGNVADGVLKVWNNEKFRAFRRALARGREKMDICKVCPGE